MGSDACVSVCDMEMRCVMWWVNARNARCDSVGCSTVVYLRLMCLVERERILEVDVEFSGNILRLSLVEKNDHVPIATRNEVFRSRYCVMQITIIV